MVGSLERRGENSWRLIVAAGRDASGRRRYVKKTFRGTKRDAQRALADFVSETNKELIAGVEIDTRRITVVEVMDRWLESRPSLAASTVDRYRIAIRHVKDSPVGALPLIKLRPHHIDDLYADLVRRGQSGSSIRKVHWAMRQALAWAHRRGYAASLATDGIKLPPLNERKVTPPTSDIVRKVIASALAADPVWGTAVAFIAWTGCRRGEACGLRWKDLDFEGRRATIFQSVSSVPGGIEVRGTKTGNVRRLALGPKLINLLLAHRDRCDQLAAVAGCEIEADGFVFSPNPRCDKPYNPHTFTSAFVKISRRAGLPRMRLHDLRHHSATALLKAGSSVGEVMDRHGWQSVAMVNRYRHLLEAEDTLAAATIENL